jgi:hypothetical protein
MKGNQASFLEGKLKGAGLARYIQDGGARKANVKVVLKDKRVYTWGVAVKMGKEIKKGDEIFAEHGIYFTWDDTKE